MPSDKKPEKGTLDLFSQRTEAARIEAAGPPMTMVKTVSTTVTTTVTATGAGGIVAMQQEQVVATQKDRVVAAQQTAVAEGPRTWKVSEVVRLAGRALEARFADVWVEGEISNCKISSHAYFTLKDAESQLPSVMFRSALGRLRFALRDGLKVRARGKLSIYDQQGKFQMYVEALEPAGLGALQLAFEQLKKKLHAEGLFAETRKRALPFFPRRIGVATSIRGAAVRDIIRVAEMRGPVSILVAPCLVQGDEAPADIVRAIVALQRQPGIEVIIVGRGGGSAEDLSAFNDERVARAIAACRVPVVSAVGHEVDYTIADFVADKRAATPSQAAEIVVPVYRELTRSLMDARGRLLRAGTRRIDEARLRLDDQGGTLENLLQRKIEGDRRRLVALESRLRALHPSAKLSRGRRALDPLSQKLFSGMQRELESRRRALEPLSRRLLAAMQQEIHRRRVVAPLSARLDAAMQRGLTGKRRVFGELAGKLDALSPLKVLDRGYGLVKNPAGHVVTSAAELSPGDRIEVAFARGAAVAVVERVTPEGRS